MSLLQPEINQNKTLELRQVFNIRNNLGWISVEIMLQPEVNQNTTLKWHQVSNIKSTMVRFWLNFGCLTLQPDFNHGTTLKFVFAQCMGKFMQNQALYVQNQGYFLFYIRDVYKYVLLFINVGLLLYCKQNFLVL